MRRLLVVRAVALGTALALLQSVLALDEFKLRGDMVDYDQKRFSLPGEGGWHCVPTSYADLIEYLRVYDNPGIRHGYSTGYLGTSDMIEWLGQLMDTTTTGQHKGTKFTKGADMAMYWIRTYGKQNHLFVSVRYGKFATWNHKTLMDQFRAGALVRLGYGRYNLVGSLWWREGGHSVTMTGYNRVDSGTGTELLIVSDPADDDDVNSQSTYDYVGKDTSNISLSTIDGTLSHCRYTNYTGNNNDKRRMVDGAHAIIPAYAGWSVPTKALTKLRVQFPYQLNPSTHQEFPTQYNYSTTETIIDWCLDPTDFSIFTLSSTGDVKHYNQATSELTSVISSASAKRIAVGGPDMDLYVLRNGLVNDQVTRVKRKDGSLTTRTLVGHAAGIDVDNTTGGVVTLDPGLSSATAWDSDFRVKQTVQFVLPVTNSNSNFIQSGPAQFSIDSESGDYYVAVPGSSTIDRYLKGTGNVRMIRSVPSPVGPVQEMAVGPAGMLFVQDNNDKVWTLTSTGALRATDFSGLTVGPMLRVARTWDMMRPDDNSGDGWYDQVPTPDDP